jgi:hypothetical protein
LALLSQEASQRGLDPILEGSADRRVRQGDP